MCYPSLVFRAELPRTGNARHAKHNCGQPENSAVIVDVLIGGAFGATVGRVEIQRLRFAHASLIGTSVARWCDGYIARAKMTVNLVGRSKQKKGLAPTLACGFKDIQRTTDVDLKVFTWIINRSRNRDLRRKVVHLGCRLHSAMHERRIANVAHRDLQPVRISSYTPQPTHVVLHSAA